MRQVRLIKNIKTSNSLGFIAFMFFCVTSTNAANAVNAKEKLFNAYQGTYSAKNPEVVKANQVTLLVDVWSGFPKKIRIQLAGVSVPEVTSKSSVCQNELAEKAFQFSSDFVAKAKWFKVKDIYMKDTAQLDGVSTIYTDQGRLGAALMDAGLARSSHIDKKTSWCQ